MQDLRLYFTHMNQDNFEMGHRFKWKKWNDKSKRKHGIISWQSWNGENYDLNPKAMGKKSNSTI